MLGDESLEATKYPDGHRIRQYIISPEMLVTLLKTGAIYLINEGLPPGSRVLWMFWGTEWLGLIMRVEHESFEPIPSSGMIPTNTSYLTITDLNKIGGK